MKELSKARNLSSLDLSGTLVPETAGAYAVEVGGLITHAHGLAGRRADLYLRGGAGPARRSSRRRHGPVAAG